jgi:hypothetical protein
VIVVPVAGGNGEGDFVSPCLFFSLRVQFLKLYLFLFNKALFPLFKKPLFKGV